MNPPTPPEDPKGTAGLAKPQLQLVPPVINTAMAAALKIGADKYGPWNWRDNKVEIMTYIGAMRRHIDAVLEGEDLDPESGSHHLGHVAAGCAIVLDALAHGTLVDNRPPARAKETEIDFDPDSELDEFLGARKKLRELPPLETLAVEGKKMTWGSLFPSPIEKAFKDAPAERPILVADEPAPVNLDAIANHIDEVVNEFPTEPLDPHS